MRWLVVVVVAVAFAAPAHAQISDPQGSPGCACDVTPAACDPGCSCDPECGWDWSVDECADASAGCLADSTVPDETMLETAEAPVLVQPDPTDWVTALAQVACPEGSTSQSGTCVPDAAAVASSASEVTGGCASNTPGLLVAAAALAAIIVARRRRMLGAVVIAACALGDASWDQAVDAGPTGDASSLDVYAAQLTDAGATQYLLANQTLEGSASEPTAQFSLTSDRSPGTPVLRVAGACGDRLVTAPTTGAELLGWAQARGGNGTAQLVELAAPDHCTYVYDTDPDEIAALEANGYEVSQTIAYVWPPGMSVLPPGDPTFTPFATPAACKLGKRPAVELFYASPGDAYADQFLLGCPGEVIMGDKNENGPLNAMRTADAHAAGGRTGFILDRSGDKLRALLARPNGFERTIAYLKHKLALGYDYIILDEVTHAGDYADGEALNRAVRGILLRLPSRTFLPYISIDLTQEAYGNVYMYDRRTLLRAFKHEARMMALEVYLQTPQAMAGEAPSIFGTAANRLQDSVAGLSDAGGMNLRAFTTLGMSHQSIYPQYRYLDDALHDLQSISKQVNAIRSASRRTRQQNGIGWYFVDESDLTPLPHTYTYASLIDRMRAEALRFK
jgi:hypothetical protein